MYNYTNSDSVYIYTDNKTQSNYSHTYCHAYIYIMNVWAFFIKKMSVVVINKTYTTAFAVDTREVDPLHISQLCYPLA